MKAPKTQLALLLALALAMLALAGCTSKSPTESSPPPSAPIPPPTTVTFNVTVTANPTQLTVGGNDPSNVVVRVRRTDNGQPPADLTAVTLSTTLGEFGSLGSGLQQITLQLVNGEGRAVLFPGASAGTATLRAQLGGSAGAANVQIGQAATFFVSSVDPSVGNPQGGDEVTISGGGFQEPVRVTFNSATATVISVSPTRIRVRVPSATAAGVNVPVGQAVPVSVTVTNRVNETGTASDTIQNGFVYSLSNVTQPQIFSVSPTTGTNDGGTTVTINGQGFESPLQVLLEGGSPRIGVEASIQSVTPTRIVITTPAARGFGQELANQTVDIRIKNLNSGFETTSAAAFRYGSQVLVTSFSPGRVPYNQPTTVTIFGSGFDEPVAVSLAGVAATPIGTTGTEIQVRSPIVDVRTCADVNGPVAVTNIETGNGGDSGGTLFIFTVPRPVINNLSPSSGPEAGNTLVTITGAGFESPGRVVFGDQAGSIVSILPGVITVRTPRFSGTFPQVSCDDNGDGTIGMKNQSVSVDVKVTNLTTTCDDTFTKAFTYTPTDVSCRGDNGPPPAAQCSDGFDNDSDGFTDGADPQCTGPNDPSEAS